MKAHDAAKLTRQYIPNDLIHRQQTNSADNIDTILTELVPEAAKDQYGSLLVYQHRLLVADINLLRDLGYTIQPDNDGSLFTPIVIGWLSNAPRQKYDGRMRLKGLDSLF